MSTLEDLLKAGQEALENARKAEVDKAAEQERHQREFGAQKLAAALLLIPEALRPYAHTLGDGFSSDSLVIKIPGGAAVEHMLNIVTQGDYDRPTVVLVELATNRRSGNQWLAYKWTTNDGDVFYGPGVYCASLEAALAMAVELYDGKEEVENTAKRWKQRMKYREEEAALKPPVFFCPLIRDDCKGAKCAFCVEASGACAIWALGENAWDVCHKRALKG